MHTIDLYLPALETEMQQVIGTLAEGPTLLWGMLRYHMGWADAEFNATPAPKGKRLRPLFLLLACEAQNGYWESALPGAAAVELLHNFSLIHDDIEDGDRTRRGRPTLWAVWGAAQAINAGDALFALAYRALLGLETRGVPAPRVTEALRRFTATMLHLTQGQARDIAFETTSADEAAYLHMIAGKTAALLGLACELGGLIAAAPAERVAALHEFGVALGMAFQMQDDLLGLWGDPLRTGKPVGADMRQHKKTLPLLHGAQHNAEVAALLERPDLSEADIARGLSLLEQAGSRAYTQERAAQYHMQALAALERTHGAGEAQTALLTLAQGLLSRDK